ncbi:GntR family transcriptional regulator [Roseburia hominis]
MPDNRVPVFTKKTMREQIADILRDQILHADIAPGERIIEEDISKKYQVSRGPVREALRQIEEEGLVTYLPHRGCIVRTLTEDEMAEAYLIRSTLEGLAVQVYSGKMSQRGIERLQQTIDDLREAAGKKDLYAIIEADERFHAGIVEEADLPRLYQMWKTLCSVNTCTYYTMKSENLMPYDVLGKNHQCILNLFIENVGTNKIIEAIKEHYMVVPETLHKAQEGKTAEGE